MIDNETVTGIICEYNPFHNGHMYHIQQAKKQTNCKYVICAMSGSMVQRGEVAIFDKWQRASAAVDGGADLVIELPAYYVLQSAENFAYGGVSLLHKLGVVDYLAFGSESGSIDSLTKIADIMTNEPREYSAALKQALDRGMGYPAACECALRAASGSDFDFQPNDILAINYIKALRGIHSAIEPVAIRRTNDYHSISAMGNIASATAVRTMLADGDDISSYVPHITDTTYHARNMQSFVLGFFRTAEAQKLNCITGMEPGLANRLINCAKSNVDYDSFVNACVTKRYTRHRIQRVIMCCLLGIGGKYNMDYVRVLAMNQNGRRLLGEIKKRSNLDIVTKTADFTPTDDSMFKFDILATDIAALCCSDKTKRTASKDYITSPYIKNV
ncbi:MAG: nucleotidyltransferase [Clostridia bacterium]|nr:nucleotidyltransferase [Clostridia bacterium]